MAFDAFIKIEGILGEELDEKYRDWIEITGYSFGTHQALQLLQALRVGHRLAGQR